MEVTPLAGVWIEMPCIQATKKRSPVTPLAGVWIEIHPPRRSFYRHIVTPLAGVWIEICNCVIDCGRIKSLPSRECGLKFHVSSY